MPNTPTDVPPEIREEAERITRRWYRERYGFAEADLREDGEDFGPWCDFFAAALLRARQAGVRRGVQLARLFVEAEQRWQRRPHDAEAQREVEALESAMKKESGDG